MNDMAVMSTQIDIVTIRVAGQMFSIDVNAVRDILSGHSVSRIPLAPAAIAGSLNLRGRIVTVLDLRVLLDLERNAGSDTAMYVVIEFRGELYALLVDEVGDVLTIANARIEPVPRTVTARWKSLCAGIVKLDTALTLILIPDCLLNRAGLTMEAFAA